MTQIGASPFTHVSRDSVLWQLSALRDQAEKATELILDTVANMRATDEDVRNAVVRRRRRPARVPPPTPRGCRKPPCGRTSPWKTGSA